MTAQPEESAPAAARISSSLRGFGLHQIRKSRSDTSVLFVHGILSEGEAAWGQPSWPDLITKEPQLRDLGISVFSYQTSLSSRTYSIGDVVDALREHFNLDGLWDQRRLVFVCHSMGGIVARRFVVVNQTKLIEHKCAVGFFLVASPSLGSTDANLIQLLALVLQHTQARALRFSQTNTWLNDLDREFMTLKESGRLPISGKELVEDRAIVLKRYLGLRRQVVEPFSATRYFGEAFKVPGSDHISISKPQEPEAIQHRLLKQFITQFSYPEPYPRSIPPAPDPVGVSGSLEQLLNAISHLSRTQKIMLAEITLRGDDGVYVPELEEKLDSKRREIVFMAKDMKAKGLINIDTLSDTWLVLSDSIKRLKEQNSTAATALLAAARDI